MLAMTLTISNVSLAEVSCDPETQRLLDTQIQPEYGAFEWSNEGERFFVVLISRFDNTNYDVDPKRNASLTLDFSAFAPHFDWRDTTVSQRRCSVGERKKRLLVSLFQCVLQQTSCGQQKRASPRSGETIGKEPGWE